MGFSGYRETFLETGRVAAESQRELKTVGNLNPGDSAAQVDKTGANYRKTAATKKNS